MPSVVLKKCLTKIFAFKLLSKFQKKKKFADFNDPPLNDPRMSSIFLFEPIGLKILSPYPPDSESSPPDTNNELNEVTILNLPHRMMNQRFLKSFCRRYGSVLEMEIYDEFSCAKIVFKSSNAAQTFVFDNNLSKHLDNVLMVFSDKNGEWGRNKAIEDLKAGITSETSDKKADNSKNTIVLMEDSDNYSDWLFTQVTSSSVTKCRSFLPIGVFSGNFEPPFLSKS